MNLDLALMLWSLFARKSEMSTPEVLMLLLALSGKGTPSPRAPAPSRTFEAWRPVEIAAFRRELGPLGVPLPELLLMFAAESGLNPRASSGSAWGINQAQSALLFDAGWKREPREFATLSIEAQLVFIRDMLRLQFKWVGHKPQTAVELFRMNLSPVASKARADVIYSRQQNPAEYEGNKALDSNGDGVIDMKDLSIRLERVRYTQPFVSTLKQLTSQSA